MINELKAFDIHIDSRFVEGIAITDLKRII